MENICSHCFHAIVHTKGNGNVITVRKGILLFPLLSSVDVIVLISGCSYFLLVIFFLLSCCCMMFFLIVVLLLLVVLVITRVLNLQGLQ